MNGAPPTTGPSSSSSHGLTRGWMRMSVRIPLMRMRRGRRVMVPRRRRRHTIRRIIRLLTRIRIRIQMTIARRTRTLTTAPTRPRTQTTPGGPSPGVVHTPRHVVTEGGTTRGRLPAGVHPPRLHHVVATTGGRLHRHLGTATVTEMREWPVVIETETGTGRDTTPLPIVVQRRPRTRVPRLREAGTTARGGARVHAVRPDGIVITIGVAMTRGTGMILGTAGGLLLETGIGGIRGGSADAEDV